MLNNLKFYNTRSKLIEDFNPIDPNKVGMYHCGPTVYNPAHIGNLCPFIYWDVMRRLFESCGYEVTQVMNFTDIGHIIADQDMGGDKMISALIQAGKELTIENLHSHGREIAKIYMADMKALNILTPHHLPYASQHVDGDIEIIKKLEAKGLTYVTKNAVFFDTQKIANYDAFGSHGDLDPEHKRLAKEFDKRHPRDFALWKLASISDDVETVGWDSPWGIGFPGWHIECSAMSWRYLGEKFDLHTGGIEHISVHHTNEIAQSENAFDAKMARYWLHNNHVMLNGTKISKSEGNVIYLDELDSHGLHAMDYRYLILTSHYRSEQNLTILTLKSTREARRSLFELLATAEQVETTSSNELDLEVLAKLGNDLDTPGALALTRSKLKSSALSTLDRVKLTNTVIKVFGLSFDDLSDNQPVEVVDQGIIDLLERRLVAKKEKDFKLADDIRSQIEGQGYVLRDNGDKQELYRPQSQ